MLLQTLPLHSLTYGRAAGSPGATNESFEMMEMIQFLCIGISQDNLEGCASTYKDLNLSGELSLVKST
jgi:hypothetical protein